MALIRCKECGATVSDMAQNCPGCGCPVAYSLNRQPVPQPVSQPVQQPIPQHAPVPMPQPVQQTAQVTAPSPVAHADVTTAPGGKKPRKIGKIIAICGICLGAVVLLLLTLFPILSLLFRGEPDRYVEPNYMQNEPAGTTEPTAVTAETGLEGNWTNSLMENYTFLPEGDELKLRHKRYDYASCTWMESTYAVRDVTNDTMSLVDLHGNIKTVVYGTTEDGTRLTMDGFYYYRYTPPANIVPHYLVSGIPAFGNTYFGMSKDEVITVADTKYNRTGDSGLEEFYDAPELIDGQHLSFLVYDYENTQGDLKEVRFFSNKVTDRPEDYERIQQYIISWCDERFVQGTRTDSETHTYYKWSCGKIEIRLSVYETFLAWCFEMKD